MKSLPIYSSKQKIAKITAEQWQLTTSAASSHYSQVKHQSNRPVKPETERNLKRYAVKKGPLHPPISPQNMFQILSATLRRITLSPSYKVSGQIRTLSLTITVSLSIHSSPTM